MSKTEKVVTENFINEVKINAEDLPTEFQKQASLFWKYSELLGIAEGEEKNAKMELEKTEARLFLSYREYYESQNKKYNNDILNASVRNDKEYIEAQKKYIEAQKNKILARLRLDALSQRKDMLVQLGAAHRAEMSNFIQQ